jgi:hypothetical protein
MGKAAALWAAAALLGCGPAAAAQGAKAEAARLQGLGDAAHAVQWIARTNDHHGSPFAVVDKRQARIWVFDAAGRLRGTSAALLGQAEGDGIAKDVGEHAQSGSVPLEERTTPAGRFVSEPGRNVRGEHVVWADYDSAFAIHRLRPGKSLADREARLASASPSDNRATYGCVVVPVAFYLQVVQPVLGRSRAVVYVLPEGPSSLDRADAL